MKTVSGLKQLTNCKIRTIRNTDRFKKVTTGPTASTEIKKQKALRKIKFKFSEQEDKRLYPAGSAPG